jgi:ferredoxin-NADP reductase
MMFSMTSSPLSSFASTSNDESSMTTPSSSLLSTVVVTRIKVESPNGLVKRFWLRAQHPPIRFRAGQWIDLHCVAGIGGYSLVSAPDESSDEIQLVIKQSDHPVATWMSHDCTVGAELQIAVGGTCFFEPPIESSRIVLLAGGLGVNPHLSIAQAALQCEAVDHVTLLYSCRADERLFVEDIDTLQSKYPNRFAFHLFLDTRLTQADVAAETKSDDEHKTHLEVFVCGPVSFSEAVMQFLIDSNVPSKCIRNEKWW